MQSLRAEVASAPAPQFSQPGEPMTILAVLWTVFFVLLVF
jgi:hypothetical protein